MLNKVRTPIARQLAGVSTAALLLALCAGSANAQTQTEGDGAEDLAEAAPAAAKEEKRLQTVTVSARKREENWKDVPIAVSAFDGAKIDDANITSSENLVGRAPGLFIARGDAAVTADSGFLVIRGIGATPIIEPAVGTFVDGVYQPALAFDLSFVDLERVELLRGPQSTLFGRNTQGGALNIVTKKPGNEMEGKVRLLVDDFDTVDLQAKVAGPLSNELGFILLGRYKESDGFIYNPVRGEPQDTSEEWSGRAGLFYDNGFVDANLTVFQSDWEGGSTSNGIPLTGLDRLEVYDSDYEPSSRDHSGASLRVALDFDSVLATSVTSYNKIENLSFTDTDESAVPGNTQVYTVDNDTFSQELRLQSNGTSPFSWNVGAFFFTEDRALTQTIRTTNITTEILTSPHPSSGGSAGQFAGLTYDADHKIEREGWAVFGQFDYALTDKLNASAGMRYSEEDASLYTNPLASISFDAFPFPVPIDSADPNSPTFPPGSMYTFIDYVNAPITDSDTFDAFTWMGSLTYELSDTSSLYGTIAKGFKVGGYQDFVTSPAEAGAFSNEYSTNYEVGIKADLFDSRATINAAAYYVDIQDQQIKVRNYSGIVPYNETLNIGESHTSGLELETTALLTDDLLFTGSVGWVAEAEFDTVNAVSSLTAIDVTDLVGERFPMVPEVTASASLKYTRPVTNKIDLELYGDLVYVSEYTSLYSSDPTDALTANSIDPYTLGNISAALVGDSWKLRLFVDNVADDTQITNYTGGNFFALVDSVLVNPPRRVGASLEFRF